MVTRPAMPPLPICNKCETRFSTPSLFPCICRPRTAFHDVPTLPRVDNAYTWDSLGDSPVLPPESINIVINPDSRGVVMNASWLTTRVRVVNDPRDGKGFFRLHASFETRRNQYRPCCTRVKRRHTRTAELHLHRHSRRRAKEVDAWGLRPSS